MVERSKVFRSGGQNVDIEGAGQEVVTLMGLKDKIEAKNTREMGLEFMGDAGKPIARLPKGATGSLTTSYEILRGDLRVFSATRLRMIATIGTAPPSQLCSNKMTAYLSPSTTHQLKRLTLWFAPKVLAPRRGGW